MVSKSGDDLSAVFAAITTTNYLVLDPSGEYNDLVKLFLQRQPTDPSANPTGFYYNTVTGKLDLNTLFYPLSSGQPQLPQLPYNTNMVSLTGLDLTKVFVKLSTNANDYINVTGAYTYSYDTINKYFIVVFADYLSPTPQTDPSNIGNDTVTATLTFTQNVKNVTFTLIGGGGGGGGGDTADGTYGLGDGGGGGQGGYYTAYSVNTVYVGTKYDIQVGGGGVGGKHDNNGLSGTNTTLSNSSTTQVATGGAYGSTALKPTSQAPVSTGGVGGGTPGATSSGGQGGVYYNYNSCTAGIIGRNISIYQGSTQYYYGGGGAGGGAYYQDKPNCNGGEGGGQGDDGYRGNNQLAYTGPNNISYPAGSFPYMGGWPATGGGGSGAPGNYSKTPSQAGQGASGIVICCFQFP